MHKETNLAGNGALCSPLHIILFIPAFRGIRKLATITLANLNQFLLFLYHLNHKEILHATVVKFTTSP